MELNNITCEKRIYSMQYRSHQHEFGQFLFPLQGALELETGFQKTELTTEYCFYLPPLVKHRYRALDRNEFLILDIPDYLLPENTNNMHVEMEGNWASIRYLLLEEIKGPDNSSALMNLTRYVADKVETARPRSIEYIDKNFNHSLSLETLAAIENYHPVYYSRWFKNQTGKSLTAYINGLRLQAATSLLTETSRPISRISEETGFSNASSFTRWFVKTEGISPQKYRGLIQR